MLDGAVHTHFIDGGRGGMDLNQERDNWHELMKTVTNPHSAGSVRVVM